MVGELIGPYKVVRLLGEGGMGQVYEATEYGENNLPLRRAAIKVLRPEYVRDRHMAGRFLNEARAIDVVDHPGVVTIYDIGVLPSGAPYLAMEYLDGDSLRARLQKQGVTTAQALRIAEKLAQTLAAVHDKKIIHRDLKPENVMLLHEAPTETMADGYSERVKVLDFGIAKVLQNTHSDGQIKTRTGVMIGTPTYMGPEQCGGDGEVCDRTDVYALGIMLYEMLAGRPPFIGDQDAQIIGRQLFAQPAPLQSLAPGVNPQLAALVHRMLAKDTAARPVMRDVAAELSILRRVGIAESTEAQLSNVVAQTVQLADTRHTTLGQATGQLHKGSRLRPLHLTVAAGCVLLVGLGAFAILRGQGALAGLGSPGDQVHWRIQTVPAGAEVVAEPDGQVLGLTPLDYTTAAAPGAQAVVLRQRGFAERRLLLSRNASEERRETLAPTPAPPTGGPRSKPARQPEAVKPEAVKPEAVKKEAVKKESSRPGSSTSSRSANQSRRAPVQSRSDDVPEF